MTRRQANTVKELEVGGRKSEDSAGRLGDAVTRRHGEEGETGIKASQLGN